MAQGVGRDCPNVAGMEFWGRGWGRRQAGVMGGGEVERGSLGVGPPSGYGVGTGQGGDPGTK